MKVLICCLAAMMSADPTVPGAEVKATFLEILFL
jgi:hypothetical protein